MGIFDFDSEQETRIKEYEVKPNQYTGKVLMIGIMIYWLICIADYVDIFRLRKDLITVTFAVSGVLFCVVCLFTKSAKLIRKRYTKYVLMGAAVLQTFTVMALLPFHASITIFVPILIATHYHSKKITIVSGIFTVIIAFVTPVLGWILGCWQEGYFEYLLSSAMKEKVAVIGSGEIIGNGEIIGKILIYTCVPTVVISVLYSFIVYEGTKNSAENIELRIGLILKENVDYLTGLYNQNAYKNLLESNMPDIRVGVLFFDTDLLKHSNDTYGHEYGDMLLKRCTDSIKAVAKPTDRAYRIGGDEFLLIVPEANESILKDYLKRWRTAMDVVNMENATLYPGLYCHMSVGYAAGKASELSNVVHIADSRMYVDKQNFKRNNGALGTTVD